MNSRTASIPDNDSHRFLKKGFPVPHLTPENEETGSVTMLFRELCAGDPASLEPLWDRYFPRLLTLARRTLGDAYQRVAGPDDAVQSAFIAFWRQADAGRLNGEIHRDNLWALLSVMTVRKARRQIRKEQALKRGGEGNHVQPGVADVSAAEARGALETLSPQEFDLYSEELLQRLAESLRRFAVLKLMGYSNCEIACEVGCSERTVERKMRLIRIAWAAESGAD